MLFDVHCHLSFPEFDCDRDMVIEKACKEGVYMVNSSVSPEETRKAAELAERHEKVYWTLGLSASETNEQKTLETIEAARRNRKNIIGLGEVGLDYYWIKDEKLRSRERENFRRFIELADELRLPIVVHSREAEEDCIRILGEYGSNALMHCFSGSLEQAEKAAEMGCLISIPTNLCHSKQKQKLVKGLDLGCMALETDAPYLAPTPKTRNEPVNIKKTVEKIAEIKGVDEREVEEKTTENSKRFFNLK